MFDFNLVEIFLKRIHKVSKKLIGKVSKVGILLKNLVNQSKFVSV